MSLKYEPASEPQDVEFLVQRPAAPGVNEDATLFLITLKPRVE